MSISVDDQARLRSNSHQIKLVVNAVPLVQIATAQIDQASFTYPIAELTVDNTSADWLTVEAGMMVAIGTAPGLGDITYGVVRVSPTSTDRLKIDAKSQGDSGYPTDIHSALVDNLFITVYSYRPPWGLLSSIRAGVFYKQWDIKYTDQGINPDPIIRMGEHIQGFVDDVTGLFTHTFSVADSYYWNKANADIQWFDGGGSIVGADDEDTCTISFTKGFYIVKCTIASANGKTRTGYRYVWANSKDPADADAPFSYRHKLVGISGDSQDINGRGMQLQFSGLFEEDELFPGQAFLLTEYPTYGGEPLDDDTAAVTSYMGYASGRSVDTSYRIKDVEISLQSPLMLAKNIPAASQQILETRAPSNWAQCTSLLSNMAGAAWYIMAHHAPYLMDGHDFIFEPFMLSLRRKIIQFTSDNIGGQLAYLNDLSRGFIGCKSSGTLRFLRDPVLMSTDERNLLDTWWSWSAGDIAEKISVSTAYRIAIGQVQGFAYGYNGGDNMTPYASLAPGYSQAQGAGKASNAAFTVLISEGQDRVNDVTGHMFARVTPKKPNLSLRADRNIDIAEPCDKDKWHILDVDNSYDAVAGSDWNGSRILPMKVSRKWSFDGAVTKEVTLEIAFETFGVPGITIPVDRGGANNWQFDVYNPGGDDPYDQGLPDMDVDLPFLVAWNRAGLLGLTREPLSDRVQWKKILKGITGKVLDFTLDYQSQYFTVGHTSKLKAWCIVKNKGNIVIYVCGDLLSKTNPPIWSAQKTYATGINTTGQARIRASRTNNFALAAWKNSDGVYYARYNGSSWDSSATVVGSGVTDTDHLDEPLGLDVFGVTQVISAPSGYTNGIDGKLDYYVYLATTTGGAFSLLSGLDTDERLILGMLLLQDATHGLAAVELPTTPPPPTPLSLVTFEAGGYPASVSGGGTVDTGGGDFKAWSAANLAAAEQVSVGIGVDIDLGGEYVISAIKWDVFFTGTSNVNNPTYYTIIIGYDDFGVEAGRYEKSGDQWYNDLKSDDLQFSEPMSSITINCSVAWESDDGSGIVYEYMDNIDISGVLQEKPTYKKLVQFDTGGDWSVDFTPKGGLLPHHHYGVGQQPDFPGVFSAVMQAPDNNQPYILKSSGAAWTKIRKTSAVGVKRLTDKTVLVFGQDILSISDNLGDDLYSRVGDWVQSVGELGLVDGVAGVLW